MRRVFRDASQTAKASLIDCNGECQNVFTIEEEAALQLTPIEVLGGLLSPSVQECKRGKSHAKVGRIHAEIRPKGHRADLVGLVFRIVSSFRGVFG